MFHIFQPSEFTVPEFLNTLSLNIRLMIISATHVEDDQMCKCSIENFVFLTQVKLDQGLSLLHSPPFKVP